MIRFRELGYSLAFLTLLVSLYFGGYYATVKTELVMTNADPKLKTVSIALREVKLPTYAVAPDLLGWLFRPMHAIDRWMRPSVWD